MVMSLMLYITHAPLNNMFQYKLFAGKKLLMRCEIYEFRGKRQEMATVIP